MLGLFYFILFRSGADTASKCPVMNTLSLPSTRQDIWSPISSQLAAKNLGLSHSAAVALITWRETLAQFGTGLRDQSKNKQNKSRGRRDKFKNDNFKVK